MRVAIHGPGRLGRSLAEALRRAGAEVSLTGRGEVPAPAAVTLLTVPDRALAAVSAAIRVEGVLLHCSGALSHEVLRPHNPAGSLHPLMTYPGPEVAPPLFEGVPAAISGDVEARGAAARLADLLGMSPFRAPADRALYHAAAVVAGNLGAALLLEGGDILRAAGIEDGERLLLPLALASLRNAAHTPSAALTGPAARGDLEVLGAHLRALDEQGLNSARQVYETLSRRILQRAHRGEEP
ncbi:MAG: DUF2520 domain-containing protein [Deltaproteobacteria bacterium]|nr:DUF2520 domain-containing protein [Deltaproteobacteria bacterium]